MSFSALVVTAGALLGARRGSRFDSGWLAAGELRGGAAAEAAPGLGSRGAGCVARVGSSYVPGEHAFVLRIQQISG